MNNINAAPKSAKNLYWPTDSQKDYVQKELDQIQSIISLMGSNAFQCKGWAIGIITIALAINKDSFLLSGWQSILLLLPTLVFWYLDAFFLYTEQRYRELFDYVVKKRFFVQSGEESPKFDDIFDYNYTRVEPVNIKGKGFLTHVTEHFKNRREIRRFTDSEGDCPKKLTTIYTVMISKTILPFYLLPIAFVILTSLKGVYVSFYPEKKEAKEPILIQMDSTSLQHLKNCPPQTIQVQVQQSASQPALGSNKPE